MKARIKWVEDRTFTAQSGSGHVITLGNSRDADGRSLCTSPMEMVLIGLGGCTAFDVVHILQRSREPITDCVTELEAERAAHDPQVFTRVHIHYTITGSGLSRDKVARAIDLSATKYCSASAMIGRTAQITHDFELIDAQAAGARLAPPTEPDQNLRAAPADHEE